MGAAGRGTGTASIGETTDAILGSLVKAQARSGAGPADDAVSRDRSIVQVGGSADRENVGVEIGVLITEVGGRLHHLVRGDTQQVAARRRLDDRRRMRQRVEQAIATRDVPRDDGVMAIVRMDDDPPGEIMCGLRKMLDWRGAQPRDVPLIGIALGQVDTGKTSALARLVARHPRSACYVRADLLPDPAYTMEGVAFDLQAGYHAARRALLECDLVTIDEIGTERHPEWITTICLQRWDQKKATLLAGNLDPKSLSGRYSDPRFTSRVLKRQSYPGNSVFTARSDRKMSGRRSR